ncbi:hypothetical protein BCR39DRAFT_479396 [Naematelia encephala]|uniref:Uncharacterized protein n=1 Tax=Naematelia encephala TaxID=71784 RepID=A0A1Y2BBH1_9TREE|nr:hypothetical protein BCR39DRAFT_479396 [Naematelia encephala]
MLTRLEWRYPDPLMITAFSLLIVVYICLGLLKDRRKQAATRRSRRVSEESAKRPDLNIGQPADVSREEARARCTQALEADSLRDYLAVFAAVEEPEVTRAERQQIRSDKILYHELQNIEDHLGAIDRSRSRLMQLIDQTMHEALRSPTESILSIPSYSPTALKEHFDRAHSDNAHKYEAYLSRRKQGGPRELFPTREHAVRWLQLAAVVKYVDGGWVANVLGIDTQSSTRLGNSDGSAEWRAGKLAWQVISEEFGDGDLAKNHVFVYNELLKKLSPTDHAPTGDQIGFDGLADDGGAPRCWTAAIAQSCIGLLASTGEFFPEAIGFNMAYETLPYHLLVTSRELRELKIDDYYFALHITIDNPDSGHAAIARAAVDRYLAEVRQREGQEAMERMWRRVQAGVVLADGLQTTPWAPITFTLDAPSHRWMPLAAPAPTAHKVAATDSETRLVTLLGRKASAAEKMHCPSRLLIKGRLIEYWLEPSLYTLDKGLTFVRALAEKKPWVVPGDTSRSQLVREMEWGGRMFGAFSQDEVRIVRRWIRSLGDDQTSHSAGTYQHFIGGSEHGQHPPNSLLAFAEIGIMDRFPVPQNLLFASSTILGSLSQCSSDRTSHDISQIIPIWFTLAALLEGFPLSPARFASPLGMTVLRILRGQLGFPALHETEDICAGMDDVFAETTDPHYTTALGLHEIGHNICRRQGLQPISTYSELVQWIESTDSPAATMCNDLLALRARPYANQSFLLGATWGAVVQVYRCPELSQYLMPNEQSALNRISADIQSALEDFLVAECDSIKGSIMTSADWRRDFARSCGRVISVIGQ